VFISIKLKITVSKNESLSRAINGIKPTVDDKDKTTDLLYDEPLNDNKIPANDPF
jgi:hypothetical protein